MASRIEQVNEELKHELANILNRELELRNALVTVSYVYCSEDLNYARVGVSVLPDRLAGTALRALRAKSGQIAKMLQKKTGIRKIPKITWNLDVIEREASAIEQAIEEEKKELESLKQE
ncbi:MAG: ribosome-binding factor A [Patescibacteria group bacterium]|jgi:ribosome-binding factor A